MVSYSLQSHRSGGTPTTISVTDSPVSEIRFNAETQTGPVVFDILEIFHAVYVYVSVRDCYLD